MRNGTGKRRRIGQDELVLRRIELERVQQTLDQVQSYLRHYLHHVDDDQGEELLQRVEFTAFTLGRKLATSSSSEPVNTGVE